VITLLRLLRNIGQFDSAAAATVPLNRLTVAYAENGRGKTTLSAILRSLATGDPLPILERHRLSAANPPHVILDCAGGPTAAIFQNGAWNRTVTNLAVFDDVFVDANVYSGLVVGSDHRQHLHELILGAQGVALNQKVQDLAGRIEEHNHDLREKAGAIPEQQRGSLSPDQFCALPARANVDEEILAGERQLAAAGEQDPIRTAQSFDPLSLPAFDIDAIETVLRQDLPSLDAAAAARVQAHLAGAGRGAEAWISDGMQRLPPTKGTARGGLCPFCAQDLASSPVIAHYRAYFGDSYRKLKGTVADALASVTRTHGGDVPASFERDVRVAGERRQFWSRFCELPEIVIDTAAIASEWRATREAVTAALTAKQAAPLERMSLSAEVLAAAAAYAAHRETIAGLSQQLLKANQSLLLVKEQAASGNPASLTSDIARLKVVKARHTPAMDTACDAYTAAKAAKALTEDLRKQAKEELDHYRTGAFPGFQTAINTYLQRFNAGFRLDQVTAANTRGGPSCTYSVLINNVPVPVGGSDATPGRPSFRNTLSAGDRNTLALAFFFASLDADPNLAQKIVVIDDPVSSLDEHRSLTTVQEIRRLAVRAAQVIVMSHSKAFLCKTWDGTDRTLRAAIRVQRDATGSSIVAWDVEQDSVTEHDRRHAVLREYLRAGGNNGREVAEAIRPVLEAFLRVAHPEYFPPGTLIGQFRDRCKQRVGSPQEILNQRLVTELHDLVEYANRFHHDTNQAYQTEIINDGELQGFVRRALGFATR
jgi:wobble nucleotide-excising tRNase